MTHIKQSNQYPFWSSTDHLGLGILYTPAGTKINPCLPCINCLLTLTHRWPRGRFCIDHFRERAPRSLHIVRRRNWASVKVQETIPWSRGWSSDSQPTPDSWVTNDPRAERRRIPWKIFYDRHPSGKEVTFAHPTLIAWPEGGGDPNREKGS